MTSIPDNSPDYSAFIRLSDAAGFSIDATGDNYVLSLYDPLHVRLGDSSTQTAVLA